MESIQSFIKWSWQLFYDFGSNSQILFDLFITLVAWAVVLILCLIVVLLVLYVFLWIKDRLLVFWKNYKAWDQA